MSDFSTRMSRRSFLRLGALAAGALVTGCRLPAASAPPAPTAASDTWLRGPTAVLPGVLSASQVGAVWHIESSDPPAGVEESLLTMLINEGWLPVERLVPAADAAEGVFLRFWQEGGATRCALARAQDGRTTLALAEDHEALAEVRRVAGVDQWLPEEQGPWTDWAAGPFALRRPVAWHEAASRPHT